MTTIKKNKIRETKQYQLPVKKEKYPLGYDIYPVHTIENNLISIGYEALAKELVDYDYIKIDGYVGIRFEDVRMHLDSAFKALGVTPKWVDVSRAMKEEKVIEEIIAPYLGGDDPVFGRITNLTLIDFFNATELQALSQLNTQHPVIYYGTGATLVPVDAKTVYFDISKNEIQFRSRAGSVLNLGAQFVDTPKNMYKRFYFVDWVILNKHKNSIKNSIDYFVDGQRDNEITWMNGLVWREKITTLTHSPIRVRPWFEPGAWGGQWINDKVEGLNKDVINYAWSFELIVPENGIVFESSDIMLEFSFDFLMFLNGDKVLGEDFKTYGYEFPIRFDFLDTFDGGNLSIQCHPQKDYMKKHFGESITQEETYYILDKKEDAKVYLGFQKNIDSAQFKAVLEESTRNKKEIDITDYVQEFDSKKHDLYLIPPGTIHGSGKNNLVLEISSTPYIYTFKMYDWLRLDLDGKPRPLNIERGMENVIFDYSGDVIAEKFIAKPTEIAHSSDYVLEHLATHEKHLYDVHRYKIYSHAVIKTNGKANVLSLVEGTTVTVTINNTSTTFKYAESFVIPAGVDEYEIKNISDTPIMVIKAFIK